MEKPDLSLQSTFIQVSLFFVKLRHCQTSKSTPVDLLIWGSTFRFMYSENLCYAP